MKSSALIVSLLLCLSVSVVADDLVLKDGRFFEDVKIQKVAGGYNLQYTNGVVFVPEALVKDCIMEGADGFVPRNEKEREMIEKGLVPFKGKWVTRKKRLSGLARSRELRKKKLEDLKLHREWMNRYVRKSKNFRFEYTIDPDIFDNLGDLMEVYYKYFTKFWKIRKPSGLGPLKICFYHDYDAFLQVSGASRGVLGYYRFRPIDSLELNFFYDRIDPEFTIEVMFHETNHYLTHLIDINFSYPHNIGEAMAEYYGASKWDPKTKKMTVGGLLEGRLTEVITDIQGDEFCKLEDFLTNELGYQDYTWGWTFVHFMMSTKKYEKKFRRFFVALAKGKSVKRELNGSMKTVSGKEMLRVFKKMMKIKDLSALEKEWYAYIKREMKLTSHRGYEKAARAALGTGQRVRARRFFRMAIEKGSTNPATYLRYADTLTGADSREKAIGLVKRAIELDPFNAPAYSKLARFMKTSDKKESARLYALALEIDPDNTDILMDAAIMKLLEEGKKSPPKQPAPKK